MKAFSIQQPWGTLICCGLKDVENRKWALKTTPVRVLIHTGAKRQPLNDDNMPYVWWLPVENYQNMGILGSLKDVPTSAIIGVATIDRCDEMSDSIWAQEGPGAEFKWAMKDVKLFKNPILNVKGKLGLFEVPEIDENDLPECVEIPQIERDGTHISIPLCGEIFDNIADGRANCVAFNLTQDNRNVFVDANGNPLPTESVTFFCGDEEMETLQVANFEISPVLDEDGKSPVEYEDALGNLHVWRKVYIDI